MDFKFWASLSIICILMNYCQICEGRPKPRNCMGLIKQKGCKYNNIGLSKRLVDEIMKRTETNGANTQEDWERELQTEDEPELKEEQLFADRAPANDWQGLDEDTQAFLDTREQEIEELRTKELKLLLIRAMLDDLDNEHFDDV
ncbi:uncharacterized protein LOC129268659 [Lytechinus pictus]|uniref:uncharacterized protein LOC129268659 n=1 Tax=Lytechinus pictus TaxID=7653 RepID=UPI0030B9F017